MTIVDAFRGSSQSANFIEQNRTVYSIGYLKVHKESKKQKKIHRNYIYIYIQLGRKMSITTLLSLRP